MEMNDIKTGHYILIDPLEARQPPKPFIDKEVEKIEGDYFIFTNGAMRHKEYCAPWPLELRCLRILKLKVDENTLKRCNDLKIFYMHQLQDKLKEFGK